MELALLEELMLKAPQMVKRFALMLILLAPSLTTDLHATFLSACRDGVNGLLFRSAGRPTQKPEQSIRTQLSSRGLIIQGNIPPLYRIIFPMIMQLDSTYRKENGFVDVNRTYEMNVQRILDGLNINVEFGTMLNNPILKVERNGRITFIRTDVEFAQYVGDQILIEMDSKDSNSQMFRDQVAEIRKELQALADKKQITESYALWWFQLAYIWNLDQKKAQNMVHEAYAMIFLARTNPHLFQRNKAKFFWHFESESGLESKENPTTTDFMLIKDNKTVMHVEVKSVSQVRGGSDLIRPITATIQKLTSPGIRLRATKPDPNDSGKDVMNNSPITIEHFTNPKALVISTDLEIHRAIDFEKNSQPMRLYADGEVELFSKAEPYKVVARRNIFIDFLRELDKRPETQKLASVVLLDRWGNHLATFHPDADEAGEWKWNFTTKPLALYFEGHGNFSRAALIKDKPSDQAERIIFIGDLEKPADIVEP